MMGILYLLKGNWDEYPYSWMEWALISDTPIAGGGGDVPTHPRFKFPRAI